ncbi:MAG: DUF2339 domain-containing protein [Terriglobia bacterium]|nr:DUF2339 domain-containing protein [Terriglobia bacterium]
MSKVDDELAALRAQVATLTSRIYRLEQQAGIPSEQPVPPFRAPAPVIPAPTPSPRLPAHPSAREPHPGGLESRIGQLWLNRIGIIATLIGISYFIKYAFDNNWIGASAIIALGLIGGVALIAWSELFRRKGFAGFSYSLKAIGIGTLYLSLWGACQVYQLIPAAVSFVAMIAVTIFTMFLALKQDAEILAGFAMLGGFATPILLSTGQNQEVVLFSYVCLLDLAVLAMVARKPWRRLLVGSFIGTIILYWVWEFSYYSGPQRPLTVFYAVLFAAIFAVIPLLTPLTRSRWHQGFSITLTVLPLANAAQLFAALYAMYDQDQPTLAWYAAGLTVVYVLLGFQLKRRAGEPDVVHLVDLIHATIAFTFATLYVPLAFQAHWITIGWLIESGLLLFVASRIKTDFLRYLATATLPLAIVRLLFFESFQVQTVMLNERFATYLVAIGVLGAIVAAGYRNASPREMPFVRAAAVLLNVLALVALTLEASDYFNRELAAWFRTHNVVSHAGTQQIIFQRNLSFSAIWLAYGAALMIYGFWKMSSFVRWQALVLIAFTVGKVFLYDVSELQQGYRIVSFIALGIVLMVLSYAYQRDWLKLSSAR